MRSPNHPVFLAAVLSALLVGRVGADAQTRDADAPAQRTIVAQADPDQGYGDGMDTQQGNTAALTVRMDRLEGTIRSLTGQIEELQFQNRKLTDDLRKMQQDTDFRFQDLNRGGSPAPSRPAKRTDADPVLPNAGGSPQDASGVDPAAPNPGSPTAPKVARRSGDAFDPATNPTAPGAPRPLGTTPPSAPPLPDAGVRHADATPNAPLDLMRRTPSDDPGVPAPTAPPVPAAAPALPSVPNPNSVASLVPGGTRDEYNGDLNLYKQGQYDSAASGLKTFIEKYPRDRLVPDAVYLLGETYSKLGRHREAAEQYLRLSTDFNKAPRAPDALLRLGMSLNAMGVKEQACATYEEVTRRYPAASADIRANVDRELKRARC